MLKIKIFCKSRIFIYGKSYVNNHATFVTIFAPKWSFFFLCERSEQHWHSQNGTQNHFSQISNFYFPKNSKKNHVVTIFALKLSFLFFSFAFGRSEQHLNSANWTQNQLCSQIRNFYFPQKFGYKSRNLCFIEVALPQKWTNPNTWPSIIHWNYPTAENF